MKIVTLIVALTLFQLSARASTYNPTATAVTHAQVNSASKAQYSQKDDIVHVSGQVIAASDSGEELTTIRVTLPVSTALTDAADCHGTVGEAAFFNVGSVEADPANDAILIKFLSSISDAEFNYPLNLNYSVDCEVK